MKNQKRASGISYSRILILLVLIYGGYQLFSEESAKNPTEKSFRSEELVYLENVKENESEEDLSLEGESSVHTLFEASNVEPISKKSLKSWTHEEFQGLTNKTLQELPALKDFKGLSQEEVHHTPEIISIAGDKLGHLAEVLAAHPQFTKEAQDFYQRCFSRKDLPISIRALCLANHRNIRVAQGYAPEWLTEELYATTEEVRDLAEQIPLK